MKITQRQIGRIETACFGLNTLTECAVGKTLINTIREIIDEIDSDSELDGDLDDLNYFSTDSLEWPSVESIRQFAQEIRWEETGLVPAIRLILDHFNLTQAEFARLIGVSRRDLEYSLDWQDGRKELLSRMTELFGSDGGAIASEPGNAPAAAEVPQGRTDTYKSSDGQNMITDIRDATGKLIERKTVPFKAPKLKPNPDKSPVSREELRNTVPPQETPRKKARRIKRACPATPAVPTRMSDGDITRGRAKILRLIQQRTPSDIPTLVRACVDEGLTLGDLAALTGLGYHTIAKCKTNAVTAPTAARFQDLFAFPRPSRNNISEEV